MATRRHHHTGMAPVRPIGDQAVAAENGSGLPMLGNRFEIAGWMVDARARRVSRDETSHKLEPKVMELLVCLASRPGEVITREELENSLWGPVVVGYDSLTRAVAKLRQALGDDTRHPRVVETVPKVGYRLIAEVRSAPEGLCTAATGPLGIDGGKRRSAVARPGRVGWTGAAAAVLAMLLVATIVALRPWEPATNTHAPLELPDKPSIAVLPLADLGDEGSHDRLADAFTDLIITELSRFPELFVVSRNSTLVYRDDPKPVQQISDELGVRYLVEGSVQRQDGRVRLTVQLIDATRGSHVWADRYDRRFGDAFVIQDEIIRKVVATMFDRVIQSERKRIRQMEPEFLEAYEYTERASEVYWQWTEESTRQARRLAERAIEIDPGYLPAYKVLTEIFRDGYRMGWLDMSREEARERMRRTASRAMQIDSGDYNAHWAMAVAHRAAGPQDDAIDEFEKALELNPNNASLLWDSGHSLTYAGRFEEGISRYRQAMRLDPHHHDWWHWNLAWAEYAAGQCDKALRSINQLKPLPNMARRELAPILVCLGRIEEARAVMDEFLANEPRYTLEDYARLFEKSNIPEVKRRNLADLRTAGLPDASATANLLRKSSVPSADGYSGVE